MKLEIGPDLIPPAGEATLDLVQISMNDPDGRAVSKPPARSTYIAYMAETGVPSL